MIITDVIASNILKYASLELRDLPASGLIAIEGPNESGKSSIGETICYALFGRTFSLGQDDLVKLLRWGETHGSALVRFRTGDGDHFEVERYLDRDGNQGARLCRADDPDNPIARGATAVENALYDLMGYGYDEFIESFYLAQREITTPQPHSYAVKSMAGITLLEYVSEEYADEIEIDRDAVAELGERIGVVEAELDELAIEPERLGALELERDLLAEDAARYAGEAELLEQASNDYQQQLPNYRATLAGRGRSRFFAWLMLLAGAPLLAGWWLLARMPGHRYSDWLGGQLAKRLPQWNDAWLPWLLYTAIALLLLWLLMWLRSRGLRRRAESLTDYARRLAERLDALRQAVPEQPQPADAAPEMMPEEDPEEALHEPAPEGRLENAELAAVRARVARFEADGDQVRDTVGRQLAWIRREIERCQARIADLEQQLGRERERLKQQERLEQSREAYRQEREQLERRIELRKLGRELLGGAARHLSQRFNRDLRELVGRTLPLFTEGRYEHLEIDEDLTVRAFSSDKRGFMELEEISSGTQRQIMLAVRLALAQELVNSVVEGGQFLFLDEPFAFFDQQRTQSALAALPELSDEITQIWIVAQEFPGERRFERSLTCARETDRLPAA